MLSSRGFCHPRFFESGGANSETPPCFSDTSRRSRQLSDGLSCDSSPRGRLRGGSTGLGPLRLLTPAVADRPFLTPPPIQQQHQEADQPPPLPPLVPGLLLVPQLAVDPLH